MWSPTFLSTACTVSFLTTIISAASYESVPRLHQHGHERRQNQPATTGVPKIPISLTAVTDNVELNGKPINAVLNRFVVGVDTSSYCSLPEEQQANCPAGTSTVLKVGDDKAQMNVQGVDQAVYLDISEPLGYGNLSFTVPRKSLPSPVPQTPEGWPVDSGFAFAPGGEATNATTSSSTAAAPAATTYPLGTLGTVSYHGLTKWLACPSEWLVPLMVAAKVKNLPDNVKPWTILALPKDVPSDVDGDDANAGVLEVEGEKWTGCIGIYIQGKVAGEEAAAWQYAKALLGAKRKRGERRRRSVDDTEKQEEEY